MRTIQKTEYIRAWQRQARALFFLSTNEEQQYLAPEENTEETSHIEAVKSAIDEKGDDRDTQNCHEDEAANDAKKDNTGPENVNEEKQSEQDDEEEEDEKDDVVIVPIPTVSRQLRRRDTAFRLKPIAFNRNNKIFR